MRSILPWGGLLAVMLAAVPLDAADVLELTNGTQLVGKITKQEDGKIYFHADLIGDLVIDEAAVAKRIEAESAPPPPGIAAKKAPSGARERGRHEVIRLPAAQQAAPIVTEAPPPPAAAVSDAPTAGSEAAAAAQHTFWKRVLSVTGSYSSAAYSQGPIKGAPADFPTGAEAGLQGTQATLQASATVIGATPSQELELTGSYGYANYQPAGTVVDTHSLLGQYTDLLTPLSYVLTRTTYSVDKPAGINHDFEEVLGFGHKFIDTAKTHLDLIPGISLVDDDRGTIWDNHWILSGGFLEHLDYAFNDRVSLEEKFKYRIGVMHPSIWAIDSYLGITAALSERISFKTGVTFTYDNTLGPVPPTVSAGLLAAGVPPEVVDELRPANKDQALLTSGLEYSW